jgi:hypothetical protein
MSSDASSSSATSPGLRDTVVTLPVAAIVALLALVLAGMGFAVWLAAGGPDALRETGGQMLVVLLPLLFVLIAAIGVRRSSVRQIDALVSSFLDVTVRERLERWCLNQANNDFPFSRVDQVLFSRGQSFAGFELHWAKLRYPPARIDVKMNVFNIEIISRFALRLAAPAGAGDTPIDTRFIDRAQLGQVANDPVLRHFQSAIQGSVEEGYAVKTVLRRTPGASEATLDLSIRQKLRDHFLASPYLKRYFAEDIAIVVGVMFQEWHRSGLADPGAAA